jgi:hypothetical protein
MDAAAAAVAAAASEPRRVKRAFSQWREAKANREAEADAVRVWSLPVGRGAASLVGCDNKPAGPGTVTHSISYGNVSSLGG